MQSIFLEFLYITNEVLFSLLSMQSFLAEVGVPQIASELLILLVDPLWQVMGNCEVFHVLHLKGNHKIILGISDLSSGNTHIFNEITNFRLQRQTTQGYQIIIGAENLSFQDTLPQLQVQEMARLQRAVEGKALPSMLIEYHNR